MLKKRTGSKMSGAGQSRPAHWANDQGTAFKNPWPSATLPAWNELLRKPLPLANYDKGFHAKAKTNERKLVVPDWGKASLESQSLERTETVIGTWLGHAGALVEIPPLGNSSAGSAASSRSSWLLFDPIFSQRAGPTQYTGPSRLIQPPCKVDDLPGCNAVFISHNHYDHLDLDTIKSLLARFPMAVYFVPLRNKEWLISTGVPANLVVELDWWQDRSFKHPNFSAQSSQRGDSGSTLRVTCLPAQHNSGRSFTDQGSTLWCGWIVERFETTKGVTEMSRDNRKGTIYHAGDTGYRRDAASDLVCPVFNEIGDRFGPIDLSFIPIWRGGTLGIVSYFGLRLSHQDMPSAFHGTPKDAVDIHNDVQSRNTIAMHWGTFVGTTSESYEALTDFKEACDNAGIKSIEDFSAGKSGRAGTLDYGASLAVEVD